MKKLASTMAIVTVLILSGCGTFEETYQPEVYVSCSKETALNAASSDFSEESVASSASADVRQETDAAALAKIRPDDHELKTSLSASGGRIVFSLENVFSEGRYYTVTVSGTKTAAHGGNTVTINGELYGNIEIALLQDGKQLDRLPLEIPNGDRIVILESAAENLSYGYELISNVRDYGAEEYPDILGLVFRSRETEAAVPEYARYFAVFGGKLEKLPIYMNGSEVSPRGAKLEPRSAGFAVQHLTVLKASGNGYEIVKYEYRFDLENKRLGKQQVRFYGWEY